MLSDSELKAVADRIDHSYFVHVHDRRDDPYSIVWVGAPLNSLLDVGWSPSQALLDLHTRSSETPSSVVGGRLLYPTITVSSAEMRALPAAGVMVELLSVWALRAARSVHLIADPSTGQRAIYGPETPGHWTVCHGEPTAMSTGGSVSRFVIARPGNLTDLQLYATLKLRRSLNRLVERGLAPSATDISAVVTQLGDLVRSVPQPQLEATA